MSKDKLKFKSLEHETNEQAYYRGMMNLYGYLMTIGYDKDFKKDDFVREKARFALKQFNELEKERVKKI